MSCSWPIPASARMKRADLNIAMSRSSRTRRPASVFLRSRRGKRGVGYCKSTAGAVRPFERMVKRNDPKPADRLFPVNHKKQFAGILEKTDLKLDREGNRRTAYSLRHTYIRLRLMEGADIYQIAKNCRTSVEMIEKYYAAHIKTRLDAAAINVRRPRPAKPGAGQPGATSSRRQRPAARGKNRVKDICRAGIVSCALRAADKDAPAHKRHSVARPVIRSCSSPTKAPRKPGRSQIQPVKVSGSDLGRLDLQKLAGARDRDRPRLHRLRNLAHEVDV